MVTNPLEDATQAQFEFRRLMPSDIPMLHEWLCRPHVAEIWDGTPSLAAVRDKYLPRMAASSSTHAYIAWCHGEPIGFIQSYVAANGGDGWWPDERDPGVIGIDQFLADGSQLNRGIGTAMVRAFVDRLFADPTTTKVQADPKPTNARAIRCYEKAGFKRVGEIETPDGVALLMILQKSERAKATKSEANKQRG